MNVRIAKAWTASNKMEAVWKSDLSKYIKVDFFEQLWKQYYYTDRIHGH